MVKNDVPQDHRPKKSIIHFQLGLELALFYKLQNFKYIAQTKQSDLFLDYSYIYIYIYIYIYMCVCVCACVCYIYKGKES